MRPSTLNKLRGLDADRWPNIAKAEALSREKLQTLTDINRGLLPTDEGSFVIFGSLARQEFTADSDLDWSIFIDGRADSNHLNIVHKLKADLKSNGFKVPGPTEVFGCLVFSHDLIHAIGGDEDTNKNLTRRMLLLLESITVDLPESQQVHDRLVTGILNRYLVEDASFVMANKRNDRIPRFLLNDLVRFWRTMAVDYANKFRARDGEKWALRNIKLRMSRKLLFVSGLFMCISWALREDQTEDGAPVIHELVRHLREWTRRPALESLAVMIEKYAPSLAPDVFDAYDSFLEILSSVEKRSVLEQLSPDGAYENEIFLDARQISANFDNKLLELMFDSDVNITRLVKKYGVF